MSRLLCSKFNEDSDCCNSLTKTQKWKRPVLPVSCTSSPFPQEYAGSDRCRRDGGKNIFYQKLSYRNNSVDKEEEESIPSTPRKARPCKKIPVTVTTSVRHSKHSNGRKMINEYVKERRINQGSYGKVDLYRNSKNGTPYAIKIVCKSRLRKLRITKSETAMDDVIREVSILKTLEHPNIINLVEVIDDQKSDYMYMVLEYVEGSCMSNISQTRGRIDETTARTYFKDVIAGLLNLHHHNIVHGDIKPENLLVTTSGRVKLVDFSFGHAFEDGNDELLRCPGTPAVTAPECCSGRSPLEETFYCLCQDTIYHGKAADTWAVGVTLYFMVVGCYPFLADSFPGTYDKIVNSPLSLPEELNPELKDLLQGLLCKDPMQRITLNSASKHPWVVKESGSVLKEE